MFDLELDFFKVYLQKQKQVPLEKRILIDRPVVQDTDIEHYIGEEIVVKARCYTKGCEYAWYIIVNGEIVDKLMYPQPETLVYKLAMKGDTVFRCFAKLDDGARKYNNSVPIKVC